MPPVPDPAVRLLNRDVLAPDLLPAQEVHADVMVVAQDNNSLEPLTFVVSGVDLLPLLQRHRKRKSRRKRVCFGVHRGHGACNSDIMQRSGWSCIYREWRGGRMFDFLWRTGVAGGGGQRGAEVQRGSGTFFEHELQPEPTRAGQMPTEITA